MKKFILTIIIVFCLTACVKEFFTGKKVTDANGEVTYEAAPIDAWTGILTALVPVLGVGAAAAVRIARTSIKAKDALMDANKAAIDGANWKNINSAESFKILLKDAQAIHSDSKIICKAYVNWKGKSADKARKAT